MMFVNKWILCAGYKWARLWWWPALAGGGRRWPTEPQELSGIANKITNWLPFRCPRSIAYFPSSLWQLCRICHSSPRRPPMASRHARDDGLPLSPCLLSYYCLLPVLRSPRWPPPQSLFALPIFTLEFCLPGCSCRRIHTIRTLTFLWYWFKCYSGHNFSYLLLFLHLSLSNMLHNLLLCLANYLSLSLECEFLEGRVCPFHSCFSPVHSEKSTWHTVSTPKCVVSVWRNKHGCTSVWCMLRHSCNWCMLSLDNMSGTLPDIQNRLAHWDRSPCPYAPSVNN